MKDCHICLLAHDPEIHQASLNVRRWLRERIELALMPPPEPAKVKGAGAR